MRDFSVLSDVEFEELAGDLLGAEFDVPVERFASGADGGIDLRWQVAGQTFIGQCKHYVRSSFSQLFRSAEKEVAKLEKLNPKGYMFVTSFNLSIFQKEKLYNLFLRWMANPGNAVGGKDLDALVTRHENVERRHPKLWVSTGLQLFWTVHADIANRTAALKSRIDRSMPKYVVHSSYQDARKVLETKNVCLISGPPGIGKTTLAQMLLAEHISMGFEPVEISEDINEAWHCITRDTRQIFIYDDFLGEIAFFERMGKNEDKRLVDLIEKVSNSSDKKLILTTREYILRDARKSYERLDHIDSRLNFLLELNSYSRSDRAKILYNHLWHSDTSPRCLREIGAGGYKQIIDHKGYNPRLIEYCTGAAFDVESSGYPERFEATLNHPDRIWRAAFDKHLKEEHRMLTLVLCTLPRRANVNDLRKAYASLCAQVGMPNAGREFRDALEVLEGTFVSIGRNEGGGATVSHANPSVTEFCLSRIESDSELLADMIESSVFFEQLSIIFRHGDGAAYFSNGRVHRRNRLILLSSITAQQDLFIESMKRTFRSASPEKEIIWHVDRENEYAEVPGKFERRLSFYIQCLERWGGDSSMVLAEVDFVTSRWERGVGGKEDALKLIEELEGSSLTSAVSDRAFDALQTWLGSTLKYADDWVHYAEFSSRSGGISADEAEDFEEFMDDEFTRWSPYPPELDKMREIAQEFQLDDLVTRIDHALEEESQDPDGDYHRKASSETESGVREATDKDLAELFGRLAND